MKFIKKIVVIATCFFFLVFLQEHVSAKEFDILQVRTNEYIEKLDLVHKHKKISEKIDNLKESKEFLFPEILIIENPYNMNTSGLYVYFNTINPSKVEYEIQTLDSTAEKLYRKMYNKEEFSREHEYQIIGAIPGKVNEITINVISKDGLKDSISFIYNAPEIKSKSYGGLYIKKGNSLSDQLEGFFVLPTIEGYSLLLDNHGNIRGELGTRYIQFQIYDGHLYSIMNANKLLKIDRIGRVVKEYESKYFSFHHDFTINDGNILALATNKKVLDAENRINDSVVSIDINSGKFKEIIDFKNIVPELYKVSSGVVKHNVLSGKGKVDVLHLNTIDVDNYGNILVSSRESSSILNVDMSSKEPKLRYIISDPSIWHGVGDYSKNLLKKIGNSKPFSGQHSTYIHYNDNLEDGQYYISVFDNNSAIMESRPEFDWRDFKKSYIVPKIIKKDTEIPAGVYSYYQKYLIDENKNSYKLVKSLKLPFSFFQSSVQDIKGNIIYNSSWKGAFGEYDKEYNLINSYMLKNNTHPYRVEKFTFTNYWFEGI